MQERVGLPRSPRGAANSTRPTAPNLASASTAVQAGSVNPEAMEAEDGEPATGSQVLVVAAPIRLFATGDDENIEQEVP